MQRCPQCMLEWDNRSCQACGYTAGTAKRVLAALPLGVIVNNQYWLGNALGESRQAIGYIGWDQRGNRPVLVEEFYPKSVVSRASDYKVAVQRNANLFSRAREMFLRAPLRDSRPLACVDAFVQGNTAMRVYALDNYAEADKLMEDLLDTPILFRDSEGKALMTINALPMPDLPRSRKFSPSGSIARKRKRALIRKAAAALTALAILAAGSWYLYTSRQPVSVMLTIPLYANQKAKLRSASDGEIPLELKQSEQQTEQTYEMLTIFTYQETLKPGDYTIIISPDKDSAEEASRPFQVKARLAQTISIDPLEPFAQVAAGADHTKAREAVKRLKDLGYLDLDESDDLYGPAAQDAYVLFIENNGNGNLLKGGSRDIYLEGFRLLLDPDAKSVPYVAADSAGKRAEAVIERLKSMDYLRGRHDAFDKDTALAYRAFLLANSLKPEGSVSVANARLLLEEASAVSNTPLVMLGEKGPEAQKVITRLKNLYWLSDDADPSLFGEDAWDAYRRFAAKSKIDLPRKNAIYQEDYDYLVSRNATFSATPTPEPAQPYWSDDYFLIAYAEEGLTDKEQTLEFQAPMEETKVLDEAGYPSFSISGSTIPGIRIAVPMQAPDGRSGYFEPNAFNNKIDLLPVSIKIDKPELLEGLLLTKVNGSSMAGASAYLPGKQRSDIKLLLSPGEYHLDAIVNPTGKGYEKFEHLPSGEGIPGRLSVVRGAESALFTFNPDWDAISYYYDNEQLQPLENDLLIYQVGQTYYHDLVPITDGRVLKLLENNNADKPVLIKGAAGELSKPLALFETKLQPALEADPYGDVLSGKLEGIPAPSFVIRSDSLIKSTIPFGYEQGKAGIRLPAGNYALEIMGDNELFAGKKLPSFTVGQADDQVIMPSPDAGYICRTLKISPYRLDGGDIRLEGSLVIPDPLENALCEDLKGALSEVDLSAGLTGELRAFYLQQDLYITDPWGQAIELKGAPSVGLPAGTYKLKAGNYSSEPFAVPGGSPRLSDAVMSQIKREYENSQEALWMCAAEIPQLSQTSSTPPPGENESPDTASGSAAAAAETESPAVLYYARTKAGGLQGDNWPQEKLEVYFNNEKRRESMTRHYLRFIVSQGTGIDAVDIQLDSWDEGIPFSLKEQTGISLTLEMYVPAGEPSIQYNIQPKVNEQLGMTTRYTFDTVGVASDDSPAYDAKLVALRCNRLVKDIENKLGKDLKLNESSFKVYARAEAAGNPLVSVDKMPEPETVSDLLLLPVSKLWLTVNDARQVSFSLANDGTISGIKLEEDIKPENTPEPTPPGKSPDDSTKTEQAPDNPHSTVPDPKTDAKGTETKFADENVKPEEILEKLRDAGKQADGKITPNSPELNTYDETLKGILDDAAMLPPADVKAVLLELARELVKQADGNEEIANRLREGMKILISAKREEWQEDDTFIITAGYLADKNMKKPDIMRTHLEILESSIQ